jgi:DNA-binding transcriptional ArsR family regulator
VDAFDALSDPTRRRVLATVARTPRTAGALAAAESTSRPAVSRHLRVLRTAGLVRVTPSGRERRYELDPAGLAPVVAFLDTLRPAAGQKAPSGRLPEVAASRLDALELEVRRTTRQRRAAPAVHRSQKETA